MSTILPTTNSLPPNIDLKWEIINELIAGTVLPVVAVALRFWSRYICISGGRASRFWWDDWLILAALPLCLVENATLFYWTKIGLGKHMFYIQLEDIETGLIILYCSWFFWTLGVSLAKYSALCLYSRIFKINRTFRIALWATAGLNLAWQLFIHISSIFQCTPIKKAWNPLTPGHCVDFYKWYLSIAITSFVVDLTILLLPMPLLFKLQMTLSHKIWVTIVFLCGYTIIAFSIGRIIIILQTGPEFIYDLTYNMIPVGRWLVIETPMCIVSVCLPAIFTLFRRAIQNGPSSLLNSKSYVSVGSSGAAAGTNFNHSHHGENDSLAPIRRDDIESTPSNGGSMIYTNKNNEYYAMATRTSSKQRSESDAESYPENSIRVDKKLNMRVDTKG